MDKGEWKLYDFEYEKRKTLNKIEKNSIEIEKLRLKKREIEVGIAEIDLQISEKLNKMDTLRQTIQWCEEKINELEEPDG